MCGPSGKLDNTHGPTRWCKVIGDIHITKTQYFGTYNSSKRKHSWLHVHFRSGVCFLPLYYLLTTSPFPPAIAKIRRDEDIKIVTTQWRILFEWLEEVEYVCGVRDRLWFDLQYIDPRCVGQWIVPCRVLVGFTFRRSNRVHFSGVFCLSCMWFWGFLCNLVRLLDYLTCLLSSFHFITYSFYFITSLFVFPIFYLIYIHRQWM